MPSNRMRSTASYAVSIARGTSSATAVTPTTRPPAVTSLPSRRAVPAWNTSTPGIDSAASIPVIGTPVAYFPG